MVTSQPSYASGTIRSAVLSFVAGLVCMVNLRYDKVSAATATAASRVDKVFRLPLATHNFSNVRDVK